MVTTFLLTERLGWVFVLTFEPCTQNKTNKSDNKIWSGMTDPQISCIYYNVQEITTLKHDLKCS